MTFLKYVHGDREREEGKERVGSLLYLLVKSLILPVNALSHSYCVHPEVLRMASSSTVVNSGLGLFVMLSTLGLDAVLILLSYVMILM